MGDIIASVFLIILTIGIYGIYRLITRKNKERRSLIGFITLLLIVGSFIGILLPFFNEYFFEEHPIVFVLTILFFSIQTIASYLYLKLKKVGLYILLFTFMLQIPIIHSKNVFYRSQTLFSFNVDNYPGKTIDIEPGSYTNFYSGIPQKFSLGLNLVPILSALLFLSNRNRKNET